MLQISLGDPSQSVALISALSQQHADLAYVAIDSFEAGDGTALISFHRELRRQNVRAQLLPMDIDRGVQRVIHTIGAVDLVLWSQAQPPTADSSDRRFQIGHHNTVPPSL